MASYPRPRWLNIGWPLTPYCILAQKPIRVGLTATPWEYPRNSPAARVSEEDDPPGKASPSLAPMGKWKDFLSLGACEDEARQAGHRTGLKVAVAFLAQGR